MKVFQEVLFTVLLVGVAIAAYHFWIVAPMVRSMAPQILVLDVNSLIEDERSRSVSAILAGKEVDPDAVAENVRRRIDFMLEKVPPGAIVLDSSVVFKGGKEIVQYGGR